MSSSPYSRRSPATATAVASTRSPGRGDRNPRRESLGLFDSLVDQSAEYIDNLTFDDLASEDTEPLPQSMSSTRALKDVAAAASAVPADKPKENKSPFFFANWSLSDESDCDEEEDEDAVESSASFDPDQTIVPGDARIKRMTMSSTRSPPPASNTATRAVRHSLGGGGGGGGGASVSFADQSTPASSRRSYAPTPSSAPSSSAAEPRSTTPSQPGTLEDIRRRLARIKNAPPLPVTAEPSQMSLSTSADIVVPDFHSSPSVSSRHSLSGANHKPSTPKRLPAVPLDLQAPLSTASSSSRRLSSSARSHDPEPAAQAPTPYATQSHAQPTNMRSIQEDEDQPEDAHVGDQTIVPVSMQPLNAPARHSPMPHSSLSSSANHSARSTSAARQSLSSRQKLQSTPIQMSSTVLLTRPSSHDDEHPHTVPEDAYEQQSNQFAVHSPAPVRASPSVPAIGLSAARRSASSSPAPAAETDHTSESKVSSRPSLLALRQQQQQQQEEKERRMSSASSVSQADPSSQTSSPRPAIASSLGPRPKSATANSTLTKSASAMSLRTAAAATPSGLRPAGGFAPPSSLGPRTGASGTGIPPSKSAMSGLSSLAKPSTSNAPPTTYVAATGLSRPGHRPASMLAAPSSRLPAPGAAASPSLAGPSVLRANPATMSSLNAGNALRRSASMDLPRTSANQAPATTGPVAGARMVPSPSLSSLAGAAGIVRPSSSTLNVGANGQAPPGVGRLMRTGVPPPTAVAGGSRLQAPSGLRAPSGIPAPGGSGLRAPVAGRK